MRRTISGFTIVELLIVIVVIAILATISVVAYSGIQKRSQDVQTTAALRNWVQAFMMYKSDHGSYPAITSCLGANYGKGFSGNESTGGECGQISAAHPGFTVDATFMDSMKDYIGASAPTPAFVTIGTSTNWYRGMLYQRVSDPFFGMVSRINHVVSGQCPTVPNTMLTEVGSPFASDKKRCITYLEE